MDLIIWWVQKVPALNSHTISKDRMWWQIKVENSNQVNWTFHAGYIPGRTHTHTHTRKLHHMFVIYIFRTGLQLCTSLFFLKNFSDHWLGKNNLQVLMILSSASVLCNLSIGIRIKEFFNPKIDPHFIWENILFMNIVNLWFSHLQFFWFLITVDKKANQLHWFSLNTNFTSYFPLQSI